MKKINRSPATINEMKNITINKYSTYKQFSRCRADTFEYTRLVGVKVCPYCNINYTYTVSDDKRYAKKFVLRPDIDHFSPQSLNKSKQLDPDNLVPSCQQCNSRLKLDKVFSRRTHLHPYFDDFDSVKSFSVNLNNVDVEDEASFDIEFSDKPGAKKRDLNRAEKNIEDFRLHSRYQMHKTKVVTIFRSIRHYNRYRTHEILNLLSHGTNDHSISVAQAESFRRMYLNPSNIDINNESLGKLKKDIIQRYLK